MSGRTLRPIPLRYHFEGTSTVSEHRFRATEPRYVRLRTTVPNSRLCLRHEFDPENETRSRCRFGAACTTGTLHYKQALCTTGARVAPQRTSPARSSSDPFAGRTHGFQTDLGRYMCKTCSKTCSRIMTCLRIKAFDLCSRTDSSGKQRASPCSDPAPRRPYTYDSLDGLRGTVVRRPRNDVICHDPRHSERRQHRFQSHHVPTK